LAVWLPARAADAGRRAAAVRSCGPRDGHAGGRPAPAAERPAHGPRGEVRPAGRASAGAGAAVGRRTHRRRRPQTARGADDRRTGVRATAPMTPPNRDIGDRERHYPAFRGLGALCGLMLSLCLFYGLLPVGTQPRWAFLWAAMFFAYFGVVTGRFAG